MDEENMSAPVVDLHAVREFPDTYGTGVKPWSQRVKPHSTLEAINAAMQDELNDLRLIVARHAAAELVASQAPTPSPDNLAEDYSDMIRKICFEYSAGGYNSEGLMPVKTADAKLRFIIDDVYKGQEYRVGVRDQKIAELEQDIRDLKVELRDACKEISYLSFTLGREDY